MSRSSDNVCHDCVKIAGEALQLENEKKYKEAYKKYLTCCTMVVNNLAQEATGLMTTSSSTRLKLAKITNQCSERILELCQMISDQEDLRKKSAHTRSSSLDGQTPKRYSPVQRKVSDSSVKPTVKSKPTVASCSSTPEEDEDPVAVAKRQNTLRYLDHQRRMEKLKSLSPHQKFTLEFEMKKKFIENIEMAKSKKSKMATELDTRRVHMQELAEKQTALLNAEDEQSQGVYTEGLTAIMLHDDKYKWPLTLQNGLDESKEFDVHGGKELCLSILRCRTHPLAKRLHNCADQVVKSIDPLFTKYGPVIRECITVPYTLYNDNAELSDSAIASLESQIDEENGGEIIVKNYEEAKEKVAQAIGRNAEIVSALEKSQSTYDDDMDYLFDDSDEDGTVTSSTTAKIENQNASDYRQTLIDEIDVFQDAFQKQLKINASLISKTQHMMVRLFTLAYDCLNNDEGRDLVEDSVQDALFTQIGNHVLFLIRLCNCKTERQMAFVMTLLRDADISDAVFGVSQKWYLGSTGDCYHHLISRVAAMSYPPVTIINQLTSAVSVEEGITTVTADHYNKTKEPMGADDLVPLICYIISKSCMPSIISHTEMLCQFAPKRYSLGMEGWCMATLELAVKYLLGMNKQLANKQNTSNS